MKRNLAMLLAVMILTGVLLASACGAKTHVVERPVTRIVTQERVVEQTVEVEREVTKIITIKDVVQIEVTPTPTAIPQGGVLRLTSPVDADVLNPLLSDDGASDEIVGYLFASPFRTDPWSGETIPGLVESWEIADQNRTVTFGVRQGMVWSDGEPITAHDFKFMYDALMAVDGQGAPALAGSPHLDMVEHVERIELVDDYTLRVAYDAPLCSNFERLSLPWLPSHVYLSDPDFTFADLADHDSNWNPTVFSGPFMLDAWAPDDQIILARNPDYWRGTPHLAGIVWRVVADPAVEREMLKAGEIDMAGFEARYLTEMEQVEHLDIYKFLRTGYTYIGLQQGDPNNPQSRLNQDGTLNEEHGQHPILSKKQVRQALAYAIDRTAIINQVLIGQAVPLDSHILPLYRWAYNDQLEPREYDPDRAAQMLQDAGWVLDESTGYRVCQGCGTAEDDTPMELELKTDSGSEVHQQVMAVVQRQWGDVGVKVEIAAMESNAYLDALLGQTFDAVLVGWTDVSPDSKVLFFDEYDVPGSGYNFCSFYVPEYQSLELEAKTV